MPTVTLITGSSTGIGRATALNFARRGAVVFATMRDLAKAGALIEAQTSESLPITVLALDVTESASIDRAVREVVARAGRIDVLVNNAASGPISAVETVSEAAARSTFETNFFGVLAMQKAVLPFMRAQGSGVIVNISSVAALLPGPCNGIYAASKAAMEAMSESMAYEVEPFGVRVVLLEPGYFRTSIMENARAQSSFDSGSPYARLEREIMDEFMASVERAEGPEVVAEAIWAAVHDTETKLRRPVGAGLEKVLAARRSMSDEAWMAKMRKSRSSSKK